MVKYCCAFNCSNEERPGTGIKFHRFPFKRPDIMKLWVNAVRRDNFQPNANTVICSQHFTESSYLESSLNKNLLKKDAVPSIFNFPPDLKSYRSGDVRHGRKVYLLPDSSLQEQNATATLSDLPVSMETRSTDNGAFCEDHKTSHQSCQQFARCFDQQIKQEIPNPCCTRDFVSKGLVKIEEVSNSAVMIKQENNTEQNDAADIVSSWKGWLTENQVQGYVHKKPFVFSGELVKTESEQHFGDTSKHFFIPRCSIDVKLEPEHADFVAAEIKHEMKREGEEESKVDIEEHVLPKYEPAFQPNDDCIEGVGSSAHQ